MQSSRKLLEFSEPQTSQGTCESVDQIQAQNSLLYLPFPNPTISVDIASTVSLHIYNKLLSRHCLLPAPITFCFNPKIMQVFLWE